MDQEVSQVPSSSQSHRTSKSVIESSRSHEEEASTAKTVVTFPVEGDKVNEAMGGILLGSVKG